MRSCRRGTPTPRCVCVNAVDKRVSGRFSVKAVDEGLMGLGDCGNKFSGGEKEGLDGDTVQQNLVSAISSGVADLTGRGAQASRSRVGHGVRGDNWSEGRLRCSWPGIFQRLHRMIPCAEKWGSSFRSEKKTQDPPSQTEGGAPSVWL
jgi:hypothetical protein